MLHVVLVLGLVGCDSDSADRAVLRPETDAAARPAPELRRKWYQDLDRDTHGDPAIWRRSESRPSGFSADATDCDDAEPSTYGGAAEVCDDGADQDCDGADLGCVQPPVGTTSIGSYTRIVGVEKEAYLGHAFSTASDVDGDGRSDLVAGYLTSRNHGGVGVFTDLAPGTSIDTDDATATIMGPPDDMFGFPVLGTGDANGDGFGDVLVAAPEASSRAGRVYLYAGPLSGSLALAQADGTITGDSNHELAGVGMAVADLDDDGSLDVAVTGGWIQVYPLAFADQTIDDVKGRYLPLEAGTTTFQRTNTLALSDADGDGVTDIVAGDMAVDSDLADGGGRVYVFAGPVVAGDEVRYYDADAVLHGPDYEGHAGYSVVDVGDVDDDGLRDLLVGSYEGFDGKGRAYLVLGGSVPEDLDDASATIVGTEWEQHAGVAVGGGDFDADGRIDLAVGAPGIYSSNLGFVSLFYGPVSGTLSVDDDDARFVSEHPGDYAGTQLTVGDLDGDAASDLVVGANGYDYRGAAYVVFGGS
jgi:hypothetical protein